MKRLLLGVIITLSGVTLHASNGPGKVVRAIGREFKNAAVDSLNFKRDPLFASATLYQYIGLGMDMGTTADIFHTCPRCSEGGPLFYNSRNMWKIGGSWTLIHLGVTYASSKMHRAHNPIVQAFSGFGPVTLGTMEVKQTVNNVRFKKGLTPQDKLP